MLFLGLGGAHHRIAPGGDGTASIEATSVEVDARARPVRVTHALAAANRLLHATASRLGCGRLGAAEVRDAPTSDRDWLQGPVRSAVRSQSSMGTASLFQVCTCKGSANASLQCRSAQAPQLEIVVCLWPFSEA